MSDVVRASQILQGRTTRLFIGCGATCARFVDRNTVGTDLAEAAHVSIAEKAAKGMAWNVSIAMPVRILGLVGTLALTRFIAPAEFGDVSAAVICTTSVMMLTEFGFPQYIVARKSIPEETFHAFVYVACTGFLSLLGLYLVREPLALRIGAPGMVRFVPWYLAVAMMDRIARIPVCTMTRSLQFKTIATTRGIGELLYTSVSIGVAWGLHLGGTALMVACIIRSLYVSIVLVASSAKDEWFTPFRLRFAPIKAMLRFSLPLAGSGAAEFAASKWDNLLVSHYFGESSMGAYNFAYNLADTPTSAVAEQISDVLLPSFVQLREEERKKAFVRAVGLMGLVIFPLGVGLSAISSTLVAVVFDKRWAGMAPMLAILSLLALSRPITWVIGTFLQAQKQGRVMMGLSFLKLVLLISLIVMAGTRGPLWTCVAVITAFALQMLAGVVVSAVLNGLSLADLLFRLASPIIASVIMGGSVVLVRHALVQVGLRDGAFLLGVEIVVGVLSYVAAVFIVARPMAMEVVGQVRRTLGRRRREETRIAFT